MKRILFIVMCLAAIMSCSTTGTNSEKPNSLARKFTVKVTNVSDYTHSIGIYAYEDKAKVLGLSSQALYEISQIQLLPVGESYLYETETKGVAITYNYRNRSEFYGKRGRWRPGTGRQIFMEFELRNKAEGFLVQISEE